MAANPPVAADRRPAPSAADLFVRFRSTYDEQASDQTSELGLFYERHRTTFQYDRSGAVALPEYLEPEWKRVIDEVLATVARGLDLVPGTEWAGTPGMVWFWPSSPSEVAVVVQEAIAADETLRLREVPRLLADKAPLSFLILYPDDPLPPGVSTYSEACEAWRKELEEVLGGVRLDREFLVAMTSAFSWELPSSWVGFRWDQDSGRLDRI